jgi:hypothetical protein
MLIGIIDIIYNLQKFYDSNKDILIEIVYNILLLLKCNLYIYISEIKNIEKKYSEVKYINIFIKF